METEKVLPTRGQIERQIAQIIQSVYRNRFGHLPSKVVCHLLTDKAIIVAENTVTSVEKLLIKNSKVDLAQNVRMAVNNILRDQIKQQISEVLNVEVVELICNSCLNSEYLGMIAILSETPRMRISRKKS